MGDLVELADEVLSPGFVVGVVDGLDMLVYA